MRYVSALAVLAAPAAAFAAVTVTVNGSKTDVLIGAANCKTLALNTAWTLAAAPVGGDKVQVMGVRNSSTCTATTISDPDKVFESITPTLQTGSFVVQAPQMIIANTDAGVPATCDDTVVTARTSANPFTAVLCVQYQVPTITGGTQVDTGSVNVSFALAKPTPPTALNVAEGDSHLKVSWSPGDAAEKIAKYDVHVVPAGATPDGGQADEVTGTNTDITHTDDGTPLQNDAGYAVTVVATDIYGNVSDSSAVAQCEDGGVCTPHPVADFYNHYRDEGGAALGGHGCSSGGIGAWGVGLAAVLLFLRKRKAALVAGLALLAPAARAQVADWPARKALIGFDLGRYDPQIDSESSLNGATPYHDIFGSRRPFRYQLEVDWEMAHPFGTFLLGGKIGFWQNVGRGVQLQPLADGTFVASEDTATLDILPVSAVLSWRFDLLADRYSRFPFIPYAQIGLSRALWASFNGTGSVSRRKKPDGGTGSGWTNGWTAALGMALNLNAIDPGLAREAYIDTGIQRSAIFAEYGWTRLDNFGSSGALILSDQGWRFGLSVEF
ncbi:MAG TPA: MXAN_2562 family outer membrane beta-barrel protein [Myxococcales bacterium]